MENKSVNVIEHNVPGTSRQRVLSRNGTELQRQNVYLKESAWEALAKLSEDQRVSGSVVIARLIWDATVRNRTHYTPRHNRSKEV